MLGLAWFMILFPYASSTHGRLFLAGSHAICTMLPWALGVLSSFPSTAVLTLVTGYTRMFAANTC